MHPDVRWDDVDRAVTDGAEEPFGLLERLVAEPSTVGEEAGAQEVLAEALAGLGSALTRLPTVVSAIEEECTGNGTVQGHALPADAPLVDHVAAAHRHAHGDPPRRGALGSTTDARYHLNIHGTDESVELAGVVATAGTVTRFLAGHFGTDHFGTTS